MPSTLLTVFGVLFTLPPATAPFWQHLASWEIGLTHEIVRCFLREMEGRSFARLAFVSDDESDSAGSSSSLFSALTVSAAFFIAAVQLDKAGSLSLDFDSSSEPWLDGEIDETRTGSALPCAASSVTNT